MKPLQLRQLGCRLSILAMLALGACAQSSGGAGDTGGGNNPAVTAAESADIITRTENSPADIQATVMLNIYRQEAYQDNYTEKVPYQATETYYEDVPYTEREAYTDYEDYYENEYQCHTDYEQECSYERECRQVPDRQCRQERVCRPGRPGREQCEEVEECGTNARGERICKTRKVCRGGQDEPEQCDNVERCDNSGSKQECSQERRCRNVPKERCGYEQIRRSREITKYRDVTRYRQEERTRTVTRYRDEERCCVTRYRDVVDHQDSYAVTVQFPSNAVLQAGETETLQVQMFGGSNGELVTAKITELKTVYSYKVESSVVQGNTVTIKLVLGAQYSPIEIGNGTVSAQRLRIYENQTAAVTFTDIGAKVKVNTTYDIVVTDAQSGQMMGTGQAENNDGAGGSELKIMLSSKLSFDRDYAFKLTVIRSGPMVATPVTFVKTGVRRH